MTEHVEQRTGSDCAIAAVAMATGRSYDDVLAAAGEEYDPNRGTRNVQAVLESLGLDYTFSRGEAVGDFICMHRPWGIAPELWRRMIWGRRALVTVPSLNNEGGAHMVYFDGREVFDPNPSHKVRYGRTEYALLEPSEIILFREALDQ